MSRTSTYIERLHDGTVRTVTYDPCNAGPVSKLLSLRRTLRWLENRVLTHPADHRSRERLAQTQLKLEHLQGQLPPLSTDRRRLKMQRALKRAVSNRSRVKILRWLKRHPERSFVRRKDRRRQREPLMPPVPSLGLRESHSDTFSMPPPQVQSLPHESALSSSTEPRPGTALGPPPRPLNSPLVNPNPPLVPGSATLALTG